MVKKLNIKDLLLGDNTISVVVADMLADQTASVKVDIDGGDIPGMGGLFDSSNAESSVSIEMLQVFSLIAMVVTSLFASFLVGIIKYNKETAGLSYFPILLGISLVIYFIVVQVVGNMVSAGLF